MALDDLLFGLRPLRWIWKPLLKRYATGSWGSFRMRPGEAVFPGGMQRLGLYLHVPFCRRLCSHCPYNRVSYEPDLYRKFEEAAHQEIDLAARRLDEASRRDGGKRRRITSLYAGGGTPTVEPEALLRLLRHTSRDLGAADDVSVELHPAFADDSCLAMLKDAGVTMVSIGAQSLTDRLLSTIGRSHDADVAEEAIRRAIGAKFDTVNVDLMFALPTQTLEDLDRDLTRVLALGVDQISTYPLFAFPYTEMGQKLGLLKTRRPPGKRIREMLRLIRDKARASGMDQCSVWSFARPNRKKYTSTTRHHYLGLGPSAASMLPGQFRVNTFSVAEYAKALPDRLPVALVMPVSRRLEMAYWLYWRAYELRIPEAPFREMFGQDLKDAFGAALLALERLGALRYREGGYDVAENAAYWIHRIQNEYALNYIDRLWGRCRKEPWPKEIRF